MCVQWGTRAEEFLQFPLFHNTAEGQAKSAEVFDPLLCRLDCNAGELLLLDSYGNDRLFQLSGRAECFFVRVEGGESTILCFRGR